MQGYFSQEKIEQAEDDFKKVQVSKEQRERIYKIADILAATLPISKLALAGFIWKAIRQVQMEMKQTLKEGESLPKEVRLKNTLRIAELVKGYLEKILRRPEDKPLLEKAFVESIEYYKAHL